LTYGQLDISFVPAIHERDAVSILLSCIRGFGLILARFLGLLSPIVRDVRLQNLLGAAKKAERIERNWSLVASRIKFTEIEAGGQKRFKDSPSRSFLTGPRIVRFMAGATQYVLVPEPKAKGSSRPESPIDRVSGKSRETSCFNSSTMMENAHSVIIFRKTVETFFPIAVNDLHQFFRRFRESCKNDIEKARH
jgi:hypothetical protein